MKLSSEHRRNPKRIRAVEVLQPEPIDEQKPFDAAKDLTSTDKKSFLRYIKEHTSGSSMPIYEIVAKGGWQFALLFPEAKADLALTEEDWAGMVAAMNKRRKNTFNEGRFFAEIAVPLKFLFPDRVAELQLDGEVFQIMRTAVEWEKDRMLKARSPAPIPPNEHLLSVLYGAKVLFPERTKELGLEDPELIHWAQEAAQAKSIRGAVDHWYFRIVFPQLAESVVENKDFWNKNKAWFEVARKHAIRPQFLETAAALQLLADEAELDLGGFLVVPHKGKLPTSRALPDRLVA